MKSLSIIILALSSWSYANAGTLTCTLSKGFPGPKIELIQTGFSYEDPEEETETYELTLDKLVTASVDYAPYQDGVQLKLELLDSGISATTNFDQETEDYMDLILNNGNGVRYILECKR